LKQIWLNQLLIAGERTAIVLNDILDAAEAKKLSARGGVVTNADEEKKRQEAEWAKERDKNLAKEKATSRASATTPFRVIPSIALTNFAIACAVVPVFLLIANHGLDPRSWAALVKMLMEKDSDAASGAANGSGGRGGHTVSLPLGAAVEKVHHAVQHRHRPEGHIDTAVPQHNEAAQE